VDGSIFYWKGYNCDKTQKMHEGSVMAIAYVNGMIYSSGSNDRLLKLSTFEGQTTKTFELPSYAKSLDAIGDKIIAGTKCGRLIKIQGETKN
jgi:hypothetical protein